MAEPTVLECEVRVARPSDGSTAAVVSSSRLVDETAERRDGGREKRTTERDQQDLPGRWKRTLYLLYVSV
jgi:hypothetical protein